MKINESSVGTTIPANGVPRKSAGSTYTGASTNLATQDHVSLSLADDTVAALTKEALHTLVSRQAKVEALKQAVRGGQYTFDSAKTATSLADAIL